MHGTNYIYGPPPVHDWPSDNWGDDCQPLYPAERPPSVATPPHPRVVAPNPAPCTPRFGFNTDWRGNRCAKLHEGATQSSLHESVPAAPPAQPATLSPCRLNLGINRNWFDSKCGKLHEDAAKAGPDSATPPVSPPTCTLNLGVNRNWLDSKCAKLHENGPQAGQNIDTKSLREMFSSVVPSIDLHAYRSHVANWTFDIILLVFAVLIAIICVRLASWMFNGWSRQAELAENDYLPPRPPEHSAEDVRKRYDPFDRRPQQARELVDRARELQTSLFGSP
jgi:hypothetical protein